MNKTEVLKVLGYLADGYDPETGELLPEQSPYHSARIVRALFHAMKALEHASEALPVATRIPANVGAKWTSDEEQRLVEAFKKGQSVKEIAAFHGRTRGAITSRLVRLGLMEKKGDRDTEHTPVSEVTSA